MKRELSPEQKLSTHEKYSHNYNLMIQRNKLATGIYQEANKYELAMKLNNIDIATLKPYLSAYHNRERVLQYETNEK